MADQQTATDKKALTERAFESIKGVLAGEKFVFMGGKVSDEGDIRATFVKEGDATDVYFVNIDRAPTEAEIGQGTWAALQYAMIHCFTKPLPVSYGKIDEEDMSPASKEFIKAHHGLYQIAFWTPRIGVVMAYLIWSGNLQAIFQILGSIWGVPMPAPVNVTPV